MKTLLLLTIILAPLISLCAATEPAIIPIPQHLERGEGVFKLSPDTRIYVDSASRETGEDLARRLRTPTSFPLSIHTSDEANPEKGAILLTTKNADANLGSEGYQLDVTPDTIVIRAPAEAGLFYGIQSLLQLLPPQVFADKAASDTDWTVPAIHITDKPRFRWRGLMLDVSRHFYDKHEVERILDSMALYKLNRFHWHLVDDQGWRIQIKKYPKLTEVGAWRDGIGFGLDPKENSTAAYGPDGRYGGFYTQDDIREVVAYAAARHITIIPEIEMPGHSLAALTAYPEFGTGDGPFSIPTRGGVNPGIYSPAKPGTFEFLENVLSEVFELFPGKYIHIGGDEVPKGPWKNDPACQALMKREGLKNEEELQSWFTRRIEKFVNAHDHTLIGWSEILQGGLAQNAVVMDWIGGGKEAASEGHDVVMTPTGFCYIDYYQSADHWLEPKAIGGYVPLRKVYSFEPIPAGLEPQYERHILGGQVNLWTEYIAATNHLEYMIFPRLCALAEVTWSPKDERNWDDFRRRLKVQEKDLDALDVNYRRDDSVKLGEWNPDQIKTDETTLRWDVTPEYKRAGQYHVTFNYTQGAQGISISRISILEDGQAVGLVTHPGFAGAAPRDPVYILDLPAPEPGARYELSAVVKGDGGTDSSGEVSWVMIPRK